MAAVRNISIYQGDTYINEITIQDSNGDPIDISNRTYSGQIRKAPGGASVEASFTSSITDAVNGKVQISLSSSQTASIPSGTYYYDVQENNLGIILTLMAGKATVSAQVSL